MDHKALSFKPSPIPITELAGWMCLMKAQGFPNLHWCRMPQQMTNLLSSLPCYHGSGKVAYFTALFPFCNSCILPTPVKLQVGTHPPTPIPQPHHLWAKVWIFNNWQVARQWPTFSGRNAILSALQVFFFCTTGENSTVGNNFIRI